MSNSHHTTALVTASYAPDFSRCKLLCESIDHHVSGYTQHYILVDSHDEALFAPLAGPKRQIITDRDLLPWWLFRVPGKIAPKGRPFWISHRLMPLHGWHVQQLRRLAIAHECSEDGFMFCDSDTAFIKPFDVSSLWHQDDMRILHVKDGADAAKSDHLIWLRHAAKAFGLGAVPAIRENYVGTFIGWRGDTVRAMCADMEKATGKHWINAVGSSRKFSECTLYGVYVDEVMGGAGHWPSDESLCRIHWFNPPPTEQELRDLAADLSDFEVGLGVQSFIDIDEDMFRKVVIS